MITPRMSPAFHPTALTVWRKRLAKSGRLLDALGGLGQDVQDGWEEDTRQAVALLALVAGQDVEPAEGSDGTPGPDRSPQNVLTPLTPQPKLKHGEEGTLVSTRKGLRPPLDGLLRHPPRRPTPGSRLFSSLLERTAGR